MAKKTLHAYEGRDVVQTSLRLTNAGDGLSKAMALDARELAIGDTIYLVIEAEVAAITHRPIPDTETLARVHTARAGLATLAARATVESLLEAQRLAQEEADGVARLPVDGNGE